MQKLADDYENKGEELKPCPFCGMKQPYSSPISHDDDCVLSGIRMVDLQHLDVKAWNKRAKL